MGNNRIEPTGATTFAEDYFATWLRLTMRARRVSCERLASAIGLERKAILSYLNSQTSPKLETVAAIYDFFGVDRINIPLKKET